MTEEEVGTREQIRRLEQSNARLFTERDAALKREDALQKRLDEAISRARDSGELQKRIENLQKRADTAEEHLQETREQRDTWKGNYDALAKQFAGLKLERDDAVEKVKHLLHLPENPGEYTAENGFSNPPQKAAPVIHFDIPVMGALEMILQALREQPPQE